MEIRKSRKEQKHVFLLLVCLVLMLVSSVLAETEEGSLGLDQLGLKKELSNLRIVKTDCYTFKKKDKKYGINDIVPNEEGLGDLYISGSEEFNRTQFEKLAETLRDAAEGREIWVIDLRRESHAVMGDAPVYWNVSHNWGNPGLTAEEIEADERTRFTPYVGQTLQIGRSQKTPIELGEVVTEKELVESAGFQYYRLPLRDHAMPEPEEIDEFIRFVQGLDTDQVWLHFHCRAGNGRTGLMMILYDKMKNPEIPIADIAVRQARLGGGYPLYTGEGASEWQAPLYAEKARLTPLLGRYIEENWQSGYETTWSDWLRQNDPNPEP